MEAVLGSFGAHRQKVPLGTLLEAQPHSSGWVPITLKVAFNERSDVGAGVRRNLVQAIDTDVQSAAKDQALQKSCVLREAFQFFLDTFEYALVAEQPQTFPRKLPIGAEQKIIGAPAL
jgi:hypothetical protein